jgi:peptide subunit release factor 1 (eRF1)
MQKDLRKMLAEFDATASKTGGNHWRVVLPCGAVVIASNKPSDRRALQEIRADLRRAQRRAGNSAVRL